MPDEVVDKVDESINDAEKTIETKDSETPKDKIKPKDVKDDSEAKKGEASDVDVEQAKNLYRALSDPKTAKPIIEAMAKQAGLLGDTPLSKGEAKEAKKAIKDVFKEALGEDLDFLADRLGPAIEQVIKHYDAETKAKFDAIETAKAKEDTNRAVEALYNKYEDASKFETRIAELMDEFSPGANTKPYDYIEKLYKLAKAEIGETTVKQKIANKLKNNSEDATARLSSASARDTGKTSSKALDLDSAIEAAVAELDSKNKD